MMEVAIGSQSFQLRLPAHGSGWELELTASPGARQQTFHIQPPPLIQVTNEAYSNLPLFDHQASGWARGARLRGVATEETTAFGMLLANSLVAKSLPDSGIVFTPGLDYDLDVDWGTIGRLPDGRISPSEPVYLSYAHHLSRLDTLVQDPQGQFFILPGTSHITMPLPPDLPAQWLPICNIWVAGVLSRLSEDHLLPFLETSIPPTPAVMPSELGLRLPKTLARLHQGGPLRVLAWGDSVTDGTYLPNPTNDRWQEQFRARLEQRFPQVHVELFHLGWGGRNTRDFLAEPPGSPYNLRQRLLEIQPDLLISEFVNDAGLPDSWVEQVYPSLLQDFQASGIEWIILTPHYVRPDWMGLDREKNIDEDPRAYVHALRTFTTNHLQGVALADTAKKWGRLWRQGIPYTTLFTNAINHPNRRGMQFFADSLMELLEAGFTLSPHKETTP